MTYTDRPTRNELAAEAFNEWLDERRCPLHDHEGVIDWGDDHVVVGCIVPACPVAPVAAGAF